MSRNAWGSNLPVEETKGGTNQSTYTTGDILYSDASNSLEKLAIGSEDEHLTVSASGIPEWTSAPFPGGCDWTLITTQTTSGGTLSYEVTTGLGTAYEEYLIVLEEVDVDSGGRIIISFSDDGGSTYAIDIKGTLLDTWNNTVNSVGATTRRLTESDTAAASGYVRFSLNKKTEYKPISAGMESGSGRVYSFLGVIKTTNDVDAFKIDSNSQGFTAGKFTIYGR